MTDFSNLVEDLRKEGRRQRSAARDAAKELGEKGDASVLPDLEWAAKEHSDSETQDLAREAIEKIKARETETGAEPEVVSSADDWGASSESGGWGASETTEAESSGGWGDDSASSDAGWGDTAATGESSQMEITEATEVSRQSEDALLLKLHEDQTGTIDREGNPIQDDENYPRVDAKGKFIVQNTGEVDRIWDIDLRVRTKGLSDLEEMYHVNELAPQETWEKEYEIEDVSGSLPLHFREVLNTVQDSEEPTNILVFGQTMQTTIDYHLSADKLLKQIELRKEIPAHFSDVEVKETSIGKVQVEGNELVWTIEQLDEGQEAHINVSAIITVEDTETKRTGTAKVKFLSNVEGAFSGLDVEGADGLVRNFSYVESDEIDDRPDNWTCRLVLKNPSEFPIELREIMIKREEEFYINESFQPNQVIVLAGQEWHSEEWEVFSEDIPAFEKNVTFTVKPEIMYEAQSELDVIDAEMRVGNLSASKSYAVEKIESFRETPLPTTVELANIGSLPFIPVTIKDVLPPRFKPAEDEDIKLYVDDVEVPKDEYEVSYEPFTPSEEEGELKSELGPEPKSEPLDSQAMYVKLNRMFNPDEKLKLEYVPTVVLPEPEDKFTGPAEITAELDEPGPPMILTVEDWATANLITVDHKRKAITLGKTILPGAEVGLYAIELLFVNRGTRDLENIELKDIIPEGFSLVEDDHQDFAEDSGDPRGTARTWTFEKIEAGQEINIKYGLQGEGEEYKLREVQFTYS